jgi:hypothetical protein
MNLQRAWKGTAEGLAIQSTLRIANKQAQDVDFILNPAQYCLDCAIQRTREKGWPIRFWVPKARQEGVSAYILARFTVKAVAMRNRNVRIVAHTTIATQRMLARVKYYLKHIKGPEVDLHYNTKNELTFPDTDSSISIYTAGSPEAARSDMITDLHNSEVAFWPEPEQMTAALFETVPDEGGEIFNESTGNGAMTWYHRNCLYARGMHYDAQLCFLPWHTFPDYRIPYDIEVNGPLELSKEFDEFELIKKFPNLTPGQLLWRRIRIRRQSMNIPLFQQENPMTLAECFMTSQSSFFHKVTHTPGDHWKIVDKNFSLRYGFPRKDMHYSIGVDVSAGVDQDRSIIQVVCYETGEQVAEYASSTIAPDALAAEIEYIGKMFCWEYQDKRDFRKRNLCWPLLVVESNNYGIATLQALDYRKIYPRRMIYSDGRNSSVTGTGYMTTKKNKPMYCSEVRRAMAAGELTFSSDDLMEEISAFTGDLKAMDGSYDDRVIAFCMAFIGLQDLPYLIAGQAIKAPIFSEPTYNSPFDPKDFTDDPIFDEQPLVAQHSWLGY